MPAAVLVGETSGMSTKVTKNFQRLNYLDLCGKEYHAKKVHYPTLKSARNSPRAVAGNRLLPNVGDAEEDSSFEHEEGTTLPRQQKLKSIATLKLNSGSKLSKLKEDKTPKEDSFVLLNQDSKNYEPSDMMKEDESTLTIYDSSNQNGDSTKPFIDSIGSWINDLFNGKKNFHLTSEDDFRVKVPNKRFQSSPKTLTKPFEQETLETEKNSQYFKSINALKEQFRKKLKRETTVHVSTGDKLVEFNFNKPSRKEKKTEKNSKSLSTLESLKYLQELDKIDDNRPITVARQSRTVRRQKRNSTTLRLGIKANGKENAMRSFESKNNLGLNNSNLIKKKKSNHKTRSEFTELEEYVFPTPTELSKRLLLNINDQEKCTQLYKNSHLSVQESQPYGQRKHKSYQSSTRCYTTNANLIDNSENLYSKSYVAMNNKSRGSHFYAADSTEIRDSREFFLKTSTQDMKKKALRDRMPKEMYSDFCRESSTFMKIKAPKSQIHTQIEPVKNDSKSSSDELVKFLIKKIKVNHRPQTLKKKLTNLTPVLAATKNRFMQSATNSLVVSVMAKKENDSLVPVKIGSQSSVDYKLMKAELLKKPDFPNTRYNDNFRFDIKRAIVRQPKFNKTSYFLEDKEKLDENYLLDKNHKLAKRPYDDILKKDTKDYNEKYNKRQEVRDYLSELDLKNNVLQTDKIKQKEQKKKTVKSTPENLKSLELKETQNARFQKQHELFKNNQKTIQPSTDSNYEILKNDNENEADTNSPCLSTEVAVIDTELQLVPQIPKEAVQFESAEIESPERQISSKAEENQLEVLDCLNLEEKPLSSKSDKNKLLENQFVYKDQLCKTKSQQFIKKEDSKGFLDPLTDYCSKELHNSEANPKIYEPAISGSDLRPVKSSDTVLLNRRYSTNILNETNHQKFKVPVMNHQIKPALSGSHPSKGNEEDNKEAKDKKKEKPRKNATVKNTSSEDGCGFEKMKKPGPRCEKE